MAMEELQLCQHLLYTSLNPFSFRLHIVASIPTTPHHTTSQSLTGWQILICFTAQDNSALSNISNQWGGEMERHVTSGGKTIKESPLCQSGRRCRVLIQSLGPEAVFCPLITNPGFFVLLPQKNTGTHYMEPMTKVGFVEPHFGSFHSDFILFLQKKQVLQNVQFLKEFSKSPKTITARLYQTKYLPGSTRLNISYNINIILTGVDSSTMRLTYIVLLRAP